MIAARDDGIRTVVHGLEVVDEREDVAMAHGHLFQHGDFVAHLYPPHWIMVDLVVSLCPFVMVATLDIVCTEHFTPTWNISITLHVSVFFSPLYTASYLAPLDTLQSHFPAIPPMLYTPHMARPHTTQSPPSMK